MTGSRPLLSVLLLGAAFAALASGAAAGAGSRSPAPVAWMIQAERLTSGLPISFSVAERGRLVYAHAGNVRRPPASDEKLLLSMALLDRFGPAYRIPTSIRGPRPVHGVAAGSLWLVGHGDPELDDTALRRLARKLRAAGIRAVHGSIIGVTSTFTRERWAPGWHSIALNYIALPTALTFDANTGPAGFVFDPEKRAASALTTELRALGVQVNGRPRARSERSPFGPLLAAIRSAPLREILRRQNRDSLNLDAELLTKMLGAAVFGPPGSIANGAHAIQRWARSHSVAAAVNDGSGLSYANRISTNGITRLLAAANATRWAAALRSSLPTAGQGTLAARFSGLRIRAKTGTLLQQVSALSGWVWLEKSRQWAEFSILSHGLAKAHALRLEDQLVALIAKNA